MGTENKKKTGLLAAVGAALVVLLAVVYMAFGPKTAEGSKTIVLEVVDIQSQSEEFTIHTDGEYLGEALLAEGLIAGEEGQYGLFVTEVNGITADEGNQEWWCFTKDGETLNTGVDQTPISDGDHFEATLTEGY